jgi:hypothetical protein
MSKYLLKFVLNTDNSSGLIVGSLRLLKDDVVVNEYKTTSSHIGNQYDGSWRRKGGLIPNTRVLKQCKGENAFYEVNLNPISMPYVKGVNGDFYPITPFDMTLDNGVVRGDFGLHCDKYNDNQGFPADMPKSGVGSLGCIVFQTGRGWIAFKRDIKLIKSEGINSVELLVLYT